MPLILLPSALLCSNYALDQPLDLSPIHPSTYSLTTVCPTPTLYFECKSSEKNSSISFYCHNLSRKRVSIPWLISIVTREREGGGGEKRSGSWPGCRGKEGFALGRRKREDAMERQCEDYGLVASRPIVFRCTRSLAKGWFFTGGIRTTLGPGLIERNTRRTRSRSADRFSLFSIISSSCLPPDSQSSITKSLSPTCYPFPR